MYVQRTWPVKLTDQTALNACFHVLCFVSSHVMTGQPAVEQGKEGEAEERGQGEWEVFWPFRHSLNALSDMIFYLSLLS